MPERARILRGPWSDSPAQGSEWDGKMSLGFVVRQCAVDLGRMPTARELADWANHQLDQRGEYRLFGRPITPAEAEVILQHPGRPVRVRPERLRRPE